MPRVIHFEIHAENPERAIAFYKKAFSWEFKKWDGPMPYWLVTTGKDQPGIDGGLMQRRGTIDGEAVIAYVCTIDVPAIDEYTAKLTNLGGTVVVPKMAIPSIGWLVYFKDTEGNIFGVMQNDPAAS